MKKNVPKTKANSLLKNANKCANLLRVTLSIVLVLAVLGLMINTWNLSVVPTSIVINSKNGNLDNYLVDLYQSEESLFSVVAEDSSMYFVYNSNNIEEYIQDFGTGVVAFETIFNLAIFELYLIGIIVLIRKFNNVVKDENVDNPFSDECIKELIDAIKLYFVIFIFRLIAFKFGFIDFILLLVLCILKYVLERGNDLIKKKKRVIKKKLSN